MQFSWRLIICKIIKRDMVQKSNCVVCFFLQSSLKNEHCLLENVLSANIVMGFHWKSHFITSSLGYYSLPQGHVVCVPDVVLTVM